MKKRIQRSSVNNTLPLAKTSPGSPFTGNRTTPPFSDSLILFPYALSSNVGLSDSRGEGLFLLVNPFTLRLIITSGLFTLEGFIIQSVFPFTGKTFTLAQIMFFSHVIRLPLQSWLPNSKKCPEDVISPHLRDSKQEM